MSQKIITPLADVVVYEADEDQLFALHGLTEAGIAAIQALPHIMRTQESTLVVIHMGKLDSAFDMLDEHNLVTRTL
ncbi:hypothetical protein GGR34_000724 [Microvirga flocculans]|uniref:Uncharacterized protein n=1 Tax=Microvirga flocculans TaxID=217168 RepID=A0A7W6IDZ7_9HYPH|nr:hypothetical protein [Microvirga flocculans]MBB4039089.1 hypothetical protein [Microvirga flocculans]